MHILRHARAVVAYQHTVASIRALLQSRLRWLLTEANDMDELAWFVVIESGDSSADLEAVIHAPWVSMWGWKEEHEDCYELVFVHCDSGYGPIVIVFERWIRAETPCNRQPHPSPTGAV